MGKWINIPWHSHTTDNSSVNKENKFLIYTTWIDTTCYWVSAYYLSERRMFWKDMYYVILFMWNPEEDITTETENVSVAAKGLGTWEG